MSKMLIDRKLVEFALESLDACGSLAAPAFRAALAEPVQEAETVDQRVVPLVESALQAVAEKIGDQCAVWYGIGARDVEEVLREAVRHGLVHGALAEPVQEPAAWMYTGIKHDGTTHGPHLVWKPEYMDSMSASKGAKATPLYTAQRQPAEPVQEPFALPCPTPKACKAHCCSGNCIPRSKA